MNNIIIPGQQQPSNSNRIKTLELKFDDLGVLVTSIAKMVAVFENRIDDLEERVNQQTKENKDEQKTD